MASRIFKQIIELADCWSLEEKGVGSYPANTGAGNEGELGCRGQDAITIVHSIEQGHDQIVLDQLCLRNFSPPQFVAFPKTVTGKSHSNPRHNLSNGFVVLKQDFRK